MAERSFFKSNNRKIYSFPHRLRRLLLKPKEERFAVTQSFSPPAAQLLDGYPMGIVTQSPLALGQCSKKFRGCDSPDPKRRSKAAWLEPLSSWRRGGYLSCQRQHRHPPLALAKWFPLLLLLLHNLRFLFIYNLKFLYFNNIQVVVTKFSLALLTKPIVFVNALIYCK